MTLRLATTCIAINGRGVLIGGRSGIGKSSLALALIDRGAGLVGDDGIDLARKGAGLVVSPVTGTAGLIEVRNLGLLKLPFRSEIPLCLSVVLADDAPRYIEAADQTILLGISVPQVTLASESYTLPLKVEMALDQYGLR